MSRLEYLRICGFKSIEDAEISLGDINVTIGANGVGKSNLIHFFWMLGYLASASLRKFVAQRGKADLLLRYGRRKTPAMEFSLRFANDGGGAASSYTHYAATLAGSDDNSLYFAREAVGYQPGPDASFEWEELGSGHSESALSESNSKTARQAQWYLNRCKTYHFHDTSPLARVRGAGPVIDNNYVRADAGNLAAYLRRLQQTNPSVYRRVILTIRQVAPFFDDFELQIDENSTVSLGWYDDASREYLLSPLQFSDGTLRAIALIATLLRPRAELPLLMAFDEPELGLHPFALEVVQTLVEQLRGTCQIVLATQSTFLVDRFAPEDIIVAEAGRRSTKFARLSADELAPWLERYSLSELWQKNILGGKP